MNRKIYIDGMSCMHCANRVKNALTALPGVTGTEVDLKGAFALIEADPLPPDADIKNAVEDAGYNVRAME